jgi:hypothetical protein
MGICTIGAFAAAAIHLGTSALAARRNASAVSAQATINMYASAEIKIRSDTRLSVTSERSGVT